MIVMCAARGALHVLGKATEREALLRGEFVPASSAALEYSAGRRLGEAAGPSSGAGATAGAATHSRPKVQSPVYGRSCPTWMVVDDIARRYKVPLSLRFCLMCRVRAAR